MLKKEIIFEFLPRSVWKRASIIDRKILANMLPSR
jgi:hypothetical protein